MLFPEDTVLATCMGLLLLSNKNKLYLRFVSRSHTAFTNVGMHFIMYCLSAGPDFLASLSGLARDPETTQNNREGINEQELSGFFSPNLPHKNISEINT